MSGPELLVGGILPYVAAFVFLGGIAYRLIAWRRIPQPGLMTLYPTRGSSLGSLLKEALFFPSLYRGDKSLWVLAWSFHAMLALAFIGHFRVLTGVFDRALGTAGVSQDAIAALSLTAGGLAGAVLLVTVMTLLTRRLLVARVREISSLPDFVALLLLVAVIGTGDLMRFGATHFDLTQTRLWAASLLTFSPVVPRQPLFLLHVFCAELLVLYIGFSKLMHFGGFFFTFSLVKRSES